MSNICEEYVGVPDLMSRLPVVQVLCRRMEELCVLDEEYEGAATFRDLAPVVRSAYENYVMDGEASDDGLDAALEVLVQACVLLPRQVQCIVCDDEMQFVLIVYAGHQVKCQLTDAEWDYLMECGRLTH